MKWKIIQFLFVSLVVQFVWACQPPVAGRSSVRSAYRYTDSNDGNNGVAVTEEKSDIRILNEYRKFLRKLNLWENRTKDLNAAATRVSGLNVGLREYRYNEPKIPRVSWDLNKYVDYIKVMRCAVKLFPKPDYSNAHKSNDSFGDEENSDENDDNSNSNSNSNSNPSTDGSTPVAVDPETESESASEETTVASPMKCASMGNSLDSVLDNISDGQANQRYLCDDLNYDDILATPQDYGYLDCHEVTKGAIGEGINDMSAEPGYHEYFAVGCFKDLGCGRVSVSNNLFRYNARPKVPAFLFRQADRMFELGVSFSQRLVEFDIEAKRQELACETASNSVDSVIEKHKSGMFAGIGANLLFSGITSYTGGVSQKGEECYPPGSSIEDSNDKNERRNDCIMNNLDSAGEAIKGYVTSGASGYSLLTTGIGLGVNMMPGEKSRLANMGGAGGIQYAITNLLINEEDLAYLKQTCPLLDKAIAGKVQAYDQAEAAAVEYIKVIRGINRIDEEVDAETKETLRRIQRGEYQKQCAETEPPIMVDAATADGFRLVEARCSGLTALSGFKEVACVPCSKDLK